MVDMMGKSIPAASRDHVRARDLGRCGLCGTPAPHGQWHHRRSRSVVDECRHSACNGVLLHSSCHATVHSQPALSREKGLIVSRYQRPCMVPMVHAALGRLFPTHTGLPFDGMLQ